MFLLMQMFVCYLLLRALCVFYLDPLVSEVNSRASMPTIVNNKTNLGQNKRYASLSRVPSKKSQLLKLFRDKQMALAKGNSEVLSSMLSKVLRKNRKILSKQRLVDNLRDSQQVDDFFQFIDDS